MVGLNDSEDLFQLKWFCDFRAFLCIITATRGSQKYVYICSVHIRNCTRLNSSSTKVLFFWLTSGVPIPKTWSAQWFCGQFILLSKRDAPPFGWVGCTIPPSPLFCYWQPPTQQSLRAALAVGVVVHVLVLTQGGQKEHKHEGRKHGFTLT